MSISMNEKENINTRYKSCIVTVLVMLVAVDR